MRSVKKFLLVPAVCSLFLVTACAGAGSASQTAAPSPSYTEPVFDDPPEDEPVADALYLSSVRSLPNAMIASTSDATLVEIGKTVCATLDTGLTVKEMMRGLATSFAEDGTSSSVKNEAVGYIIASSLMAYCPWYG